MAGEIGDIITNNDMRNKVKEISKKFPLECQEQAQKSFDCIFTLFQKLDFNDERLRDKRQEIFTKRITPYCFQSYDLDECVLKYRKQ